MKRAYTGMVREIAGVASGIVDSVVKACVLLTLKRRMGLCLWRVGGVGSAFCVELPHGIIKWAMGGGSPAQKQKIKRCGHIAAFGGIPKRRGASTQSIKAVI